MVQAFVVPALRKLREERGTQFLGEATEIKAGPPVYSVKVNVLFRPRRYCTKST
jgi:hypothetical protein